MKELAELLFLGINLSANTDWIKKYYIIICIVLAVLIVGTIVFICVKKKKRKKAIENGIYKYIDPKDIASADDLKHIKTKSLNEKIEMYKGYCRYQDDTQEYIKRTDEQQKIYDEYFVVKNLRTITCDPKNRKKSDIFKIIKIVSLILGIVCILVGLVFLFILLVSIVFIIATIVCYIMQRVFLKKFNSSLEQADGPEKLISDEEYETLVNNKIEEMDILNSGINKLGLEQSVSESADSIIIKDKVINDKSLYVYNENNNSLHSSTQFVSLFIFLQKKLYVYKVQFDMCNNMKEEWMNEFDYKDICDCSLYTKKVIKKIYDDRYIEFDVSRFELTALNSKISLDIFDEELVQKLKKKIREKKN